MSRVKTTHEKNRVPLHYRNSLLVKIFMVPTSFTIVSSIFQIPNNISTLLNLLSQMSYSFGERKQRGKRITGHIARYHMAVLHILSHTICRVRTIAYIHVLFEMRTLAPKNPKTCPYSDNLDVVLLVSIRCPHFFHLKVLSKTCLSFPQGCFHN